MTAYSYGQCEFVTTGQWTSTQQEQFQASMGPVVTTIDVDTDDGFTSVNTVLTTTTLTTTDPSWFSLPVAGGPSIQLRLVWDISEDFNPLADIDDPNDDKGINNFTINFSQPVICPIIHLERIGGFGRATTEDSIGISNSLELTLNTPGATFVQPAGSGTSDFLVTSNTVSKIPDVSIMTSGEGVATEEANTGSAAGSVKISTSGPVTSLKFLWTGIGVEGIGGDRFEIAVSAIPSCFPVPVLEKSVSDIQPSSGGNFLVDFNFLLANSGEVTMENLSLLDSLSSKLGCSFVGIASPPTMNLQNFSGLSTLPTINPLFDGLTESNIFTGTDGELEPGDLIDVMLSVIVDPDCQGASDTLSNQATLLGENEIGGTLFDLSDDPNDPTNIDPDNNGNPDDPTKFTLSRIGLDKKADLSLLSNPIEAGDVILYDFTVCNIGNDVLSDISITDDELGASVTGSLSLLAPGNCDSTSFQASYTIQSSDLVAGMFSNQAEVSATSSSGFVVTDLSDDPCDETNVDIDGDGEPDDVTIVSLEPEPKLSLDKISNLQFSGSANPGDIISYQFVICNIGALPLNSIVINDPLVNVTGGPISLLPNECSTTDFVGNYMITQLDIDRGFVDNTASSTGTDPFSTSVTDTSSVRTILLQNSSIELFKSDDVNSISNPSAVGDEISYIFEVCNNGNVTIDNIFITDELLTVNQGDLTLLPGECAEDIIGTYTLTIDDIRNLEVTNTASVSGTNPVGGNVSDVSDDPDGNLPGEDDPTISTLFECILTIGTYELIPNACIDSTPIDITFNQTTIGQLPSGYSRLYVLVENSTGIISATSQSPQFAISNAASYGIYALVANISNPNSGNFFDPSFIINGLTTLSDIETKVVLEAICARLFLIQDILLSQQPRINFLENIRICNSTQLGMVDAIDLDTLLIDSLDGIWQLSATTPMNPLANNSIPADGSGLISGSQFQFTNVVPGLYTFIFESTSAVDPCINVTDSIAIEVVDCFAECEELVCISNVKVSLNDECMLILEPDDLLENPVLGLYTIDLFFEDGTPYNSDTLNEQTINFKFQFNVGCLDNTCWGNLKVESNKHPDFDPICGCADDGIIDDRCKFWCTGKADLPSSIITTEEVIAEYEECGPELLGDVIVEETTSGDVCDVGGLTRELKYSVKVKIGELTETVEILCQSYIEYKHDIDVDSVEFNSKFGFPDDITLDCAYLEELDEDLSFEFASPHSIQAFTNKVESAFPFFVNKHELIADSIAIPDTNIVQTGEILLDSMVYNDFDNDGIDEWELLTVVKKTFDTIITDSLIPTGLIIHPKVAIDKKICNILSSYTDVSFDACGEGTKILREWSIIDFCNDTSEKKDIQVIEIVDQAAPVVYKEVDGEQIPIFELEPLLTGVAPWTCGGVIELPQLKIKDNCDPEPSVIWSIDEGRIEDGFITDIWLDQDPITAYAKVIDHCQNSVTVSMKVTVIDDVPPVVVADQELTVSLAFGIPDTEGTGKILASELDEGSHDSGCGEVVFKVVRMDDWAVRVQDCNEAFVGFEATSCDPITTAVDIGNRGKSNCEFDSTNILQIVTEPADFVKFCCDDIGEAVPVIFFVIDEAGNTNQTKVNIFIQDQSVPTLVCQNQLLDCSDEEELEILDDLDNLFLLAPFVEGGACPTNEEDIEIASVDNKDGPCGSRTVTVEWFLDIDGTGDPTFGDPMCTQELVVDLTGQTLDPFKIMWPHHYTGETYWGQKLECDTSDIILSKEIEITLPDLNCSADLSNDSGPVWCDSECGIIGVSSEMDTILSSDVCMKIIKRWAVVDWCVWTANNDTTIIGNDSLIIVKDLTINQCSDCALSGPFDLDSIYFRYANIAQDGFYTYDQIIKISDDTAPQLSIADTILVSIKHGAESKEDKSICSGEDYIVASAMDFCGGALTSNDLTWRVNVRNAAGELLSNNVINDPGLNPSVTIRNTLQSVEFDLEDETVIDGPLSSQIDSQLEFPQFAGLYDIDVQVNRIDISFNPNEERFPFDTPRVLEEGTFDRYYFSFENIGIEGIQVDPGASLQPELEIISDNEFVVTIGPGMEIGPGFDATIIIESSISQSVVIHTGAGSVGDQHTIEWSVSDDCGNESNLTSVVLFVDDVKPVPLCLSDVTTVLLEENGTAKITADQFDFSSFDNCTLAEDLEFTVMLSGERPIFPDEEGFYSQKHIELNCLDLLDDNQLDVWVWDESGNGEFCRVRVNLTDRDEDCQNFEEASQGLIAGTVSLVNGLPISGVNIDLHTSLEEYPKSQITDSDGKYRFEANPSQFNYQLEGDRIDEFSNGLSTLDLVHIQRHIIGLAAFESPYKIIAADANGDQSVSVSDIVSLRRIVLGLDKGMANQKPWLFVKANQDFIDKQTPWPFTQQVLIQDYSGKSSFEDFYGVKIGDVNDDVFLEGSEVTEKRSFSDLVFQVKDKQINKAETITIPFQTRDVVNLYGIQFTLSHGSILKLVGYADGLLDIDDTNFGVFEDHITFSYNNDVAIQSDDVLFELNFEVVESSLLSSLIGINSTVTSAQAYMDLSNNYLRPLIVFAEEVGTLQVSQNVPNPFSEETSISFYVPMESQVELSIYDMLGHMHYFNSSIYSSGNHNLRIDRDQLSSGGIYYYQLKTNKEKVISKMIFIDY